VVPDIFCVIVALFFLTYKSMYKFKCTRQKA